MPPHDTCANVARVISSEGISRQTHDRESGIRSVAKCNSLPLPFFATLVTVTCRHSL